MKLLEPLTVGTMRLKNRFVMPPMVTNFATREGYVTDRSRNYYGARAEGGVGLVIVEATCIETPVGKGFYNQLVIDDDKFIPGLRTLAEAIQRHGARAAIQLHHAGRNSSSAITGQQLVAPSAIPMPNGEIPRELTVDEIKATIRRFAEAAGRAKEVGFDAVEIHAAHGYLISQFLSAGSNKRQDEYGGDLKNRARMLLETIAAVKTAVGDSYPVWCRINGREYGIEGGITIEEAQETARMCQAAGIVAVHVSAFGYGTDPRHLPLSAQREGYLLRFAEAVKPAVNLPVITVGGMTLALGEKALQEGKANLIAIGRGLLADPQIPNKVAENRPEDITPCILCGTCQGGLQGEGATLHCRVNPALGQEGESIITRADKPKKVVVIGGGPAGMEAAMIAARRGHQVTLLEKDWKLGGQLLLAAIPPYKERLAKFNEYLTIQIEKAGISVKTGQEAGITEIEALAPDAVVLATGLVPFIPEIPGIDGSHVVLAEDVLTGRAQVGERVVIIGGELVGCETAEFLVDAEKKVTIARRGPTIAVAQAPIVREPLVGRLADKGVTMLTGVRYEEITPDGLVITNREGRQQTIPADTIVLAAGSRPNTELLKALEEKVPEVYRIGDCLEPRSLMEALAEGFHSGRNL